MSASVVTLCHARPKMLTAPAKSQLTIGRRPSPVENGVCDAKTTPTSIFLIIIERYKSTVCALLKYKKYMYIYCILLRVYHKFGDINPKKFILTFICIKWDPLVSFLCMILLMSVLQCFLSHNPPVMYAMYEFQ